MVAVVVVVVEVVFPHSISASDVISASRRLIPPVVVDYPIELLFEDRLNDLVVVVVVAVSPVEVDLLIFQDDVTIAEITIIGVRLAKIDTEVLRLSKKVCGF